MSEIASQIIRVSIVRSIVYSGADQRKKQRPASLAFVKELHGWPVDSPHKRSVKRQMFSFDDVIMYTLVFNAKCEFQGLRKMCPKRPFLIPYVNQN